MSISENLVNVKEKNQTLAMNLKNYAKHKNLALTIQKTLASFYKRKEFKSEKLEDRFSHQGLAILNCGNSLSFNKYHNEEKTIKLNHANFCKNRLCPMCAWRWHLKYNAIIKRTFQILGKGHYYHLVLTIPNLKVINKQILLNLKERASLFLKKYMKINDYFLGFEMTIGKDKSYHPHFHIVLFSAEKLELPTKKEMQTIWAQFTGYGKYNIINIQECSENEVSLELTKYILKFETKEDQEELIKETLYPVYVALKGLRKFSTSGLVKKAEQQAKKELEEEYLEEILALKEFDYDTYFYEWLGQSYEQTGLMSKQAKKN